ncbi:MAG: helix-turn-helix domain-containing protein [Micromonosporaceae bacterium]
MATTARNWRDVRADAIRSGHITEEGIAAARQVHKDQAHAYRLRQIRQAQSVRQSDVAAEMNVSQGRVSRIENGELDHTELGTLQRYVQALGGQLRVVADFGDEQLTLA